MNVSVSYLMPSYNHEKYIYGALESIRLDVELLCSSAEFRCN